MSLGIEEVPGKNRTRQRPDPYGLRLSGELRPETLEILEAFNAHSYDKAPDSIRVNTSIGRLGVTLFSGVTNDGDMFAIRCLNVNAAHEVNNGFNNIPRHAISQGTLAEGKRDWDWQPVFNEESDTDDLELVLLLPTSDDDNLRKLKLTSKAISYEQEECHSIPVRYVREILTQYQHGLDRIELLNRELVEVNVSPMWNGNEIKDKRLIDKTNIKWQD